MDLNSIINLAILFIVVYILARIFIPKQVDRFESYFFDQLECFNCEKCVYDPKVEELKTILEDWFGSRVSPWKGNLESLNSKSENVMNQIRLCKGGSSYTIDKQFMYICTKDENDEYYEDTMLMHVLLHETAHVICDEIGHTKKFDDIFRELMDEAHAPTCPNQSPIYDKFAPLVDNYCGVTADDTYSVE